MMFCLTLGLSLYHDDDDDHADGDDDDDTGARRKRCNVDLTRRPGHKKHWGSAANPGCSWEGFFFSAFLFYIILDHLVV